MRVDDFQADEIQILKDCCAVVDHSGRKSMFDPTLAQLKARVL